MVQVLFQRAPSPNPPCQRRARIRAVHRFEHGHPGDALSATRVPARSIAGRERCRASESPLTGHEHRRRQRRRPAENRRPVPTSPFRPDASGNHPVTIRSSPPRGEGSTRPDDRAKRSAPTLKRRCHSGYGNALTWQQGQPGQRGHPRAPHGLHGTATPQPVSTFTSVKALHYVTTDLESWGSVRRGGMASVD